MKAEAPPAEGEAGEAAEEGSGDGTPTAAALTSPRRSARLAGRPPEAASEMASSRGSRRKRTAEQDAAGSSSVPGDAAAPGSSLKVQGGDSRADCIDLNLTPAPSPAGRAKGRTMREDLMNLNVLPKASPVVMEQDKIQDRASATPRATRRRAEAVDAPADEAETPARGGDKGKRILVADDGEDSGPRGLKRTQGRRYSEEQKGKRKLFVQGDDAMTAAPDDQELKLELRVSGKTDYSGREAIKLAKNDRTAHRARIAESQRLKAVELAPEFAVVKPDQEDESEGSDNEESSGEEPEDWPGPFATAMKIIHDREKLFLTRRTGATPAPSAGLKINLVRSSNNRQKSSERQIPSLRELCLQILSDYAAEIKSLEGVPDDLRNLLSRHLCNIRKMDEHMLDLFASGSPCEISIPDCSWATEDQLEKILGRASTDRLTVLELNHCGRCLHDGTLSSAGIPQPRFPSLAAISLKGAYRLSDDGLKQLASSAPQLSSVGLGQCSRITPAGVNFFLEQLKHSLVKLVLDDCSVDAPAILPGLRGLEKLEALSMAAVPGVNDKFVGALVSVHGARLTALGFSGCRALTAASLREIAKSCAQLRCVDLRDLVKVNDRALAHLAGGCTSLRRLLLRRNPLSDKAVAAFVQAAGGALTELSVNNIKEASNMTAQAIAAQCSVNLQELDLSFCREMTNEGLALIASSCSRLLTLKLFGCPQISPEFLDGYSDGKLLVVGMDGPILRHLRFPPASS